MNFKKGFNLAQIISIFLIFIGIAIFIFMATKIGLIKIPNLAKKETSSKQQSIDPEKKYCGYAKQTLDWLNSKRDENGKYFSFINCDSPEKPCNSNQKSGQSGHDAISAIWARYKYIQKTGDKNEIDILKKDIDLYYNQLSQMEVQNDFWNCRLLLEITDSKILDQSYLDKVKELCFTSTYLSTNNVKNILNPDTGIFEFKPVSPITPLDLEVFSKSETPKNNSTINNKNYDSHVTYPSDFVARYKSTKNQNDLDIANAYFNEFLLSYRQNPNNFLPASRCLLAVSSLDLFSLNKDNRYLEFAKNTYSSLFNSDQYKSESVTIECALLNRELSRIDQSETNNYSSIKNQLLESFTSQRLDPDGGFFLLDGSTSFSKDLRQNALMVNLLCQ